jgi:hypothetical protein
VTSHLGVLALFAACISIVFATLQRDTLHDQLTIAARIFGALVGGAFVLGWILYGLFR